jgi:sugar phosphate isomerase/epimerase
VQTTASPFVLSFMTANYVAEELGYGRADEWGPFDDATNAAFAPVETFGARFGGLLERVTSIGFDAIDLWFGHLNWRWATAEHVTLAGEALAAYGVRVVSLAGSVGATTEELAAACRLANALGVDLIVGLGEIVRSDRGAAARVLREHGVRFGLENHPERKPSEVLEVIGNESDVLGAGVDTGWWATQGYDPVAAIEELSERLFHVHLKDVEALGTHVTCMYGDGCARITECVDALLRIGYAGPVSIEHEPYDRDPTAECARMLSMLREHLSSEAASRV